MSRTTKTVTDTICDNCLNQITMTSKGTMQMVPIDIRNADYSCDAIVLDFCCVQCLGRWIQKQLENGVKSVSIYGRILSQRKGE